MANKSRYIIAESSIKAYFRDAPEKVYNESMLEGLLNENRIAWNLPASMRLDKFTDRLKSSEILQEHDIFLQGLNQTRKRYATPDASPFQIAVALIAKSFLSHYTAVFLHGLTTQVPKTIYVSYEQSEKNQPRGTLTQTAIDSAFSKQQRSSTNVASLGEYTLIFHNGKYAGRTGVFNFDGLPVTNLERTLIDIAVRPDYAGGVSSVLDAYRRSIEQVSINKLIAALDNYDFIYPYHQVIGFYLEKAGIPSEKLVKLKEREMEFDFYLTYQISQPEYDSNWRLYYPKGI